MKNIIVLVTLCCVSVPSASAMSFADAAENLLYFEHAKQSAHYCQERGVSTSHAFAAWQEEHRSLYRKSIQIIRTEAANRGLSKEEQDSVLTESIDNQRKLAQENIAKKGVLCKRFGALLGGYNTLLKR